MEILAAVGALWISIWLLVLLGHGIVLLATMPFRMRMPYEYQLELMRPEHLRRPRYEPMPLPAPDRPLQLRSVQVVEHRIYD